ncbi:hypothetical protein NQZ68_023730 [Scomber scombrus]|uniref:Uncharacterized protein n=1 Tax=Scomber scombrus TaxID=13677 RepID=A0AAV1Q9J0_SCOSC
MLAFGKSGKVSISSASPTQAGSEPSQPADWCHAAAPAQCASAAVAARILDQELLCPVRSVSALSPENAQSSRSCVAARIAQKYTRETRY